VKKIDTYKIVALRKHYQLKQEDVAKALDIGRVTYITREKHGSFTDDELNKLSELLNVERSELVIEEGSFTGDQLNKLSELLNLLPPPSSTNNIEYIIPSKSYASFPEIISTKENVLSDLLKEETDASKIELPADVKKTIAEQLKPSSESESTYQSKYISLLENQLLEKEEVIKELRETLLRLEGQMKLMFNDINYQNEQLLEFSRELKFRLEADRFSIKSIEQLMLKQKGGDKK
jgi:DNA-binding XRE family transcriptional regulator